MKLLRESIRLILREADARASCPLPTQDLELNTKNRNAAIKAEKAQGSVSESRKRRLMDKEQLERVLKAHKLWAKTGGVRGQRANLSRANLTGADLTGADLSQADLSRANLSGADLSRANLFGADLSWANLSRADLSGAYLTGANLSGADLTGANLSSAHLTGADLSGAGLSGANLTGANLHGANLTEANLYRANLTEANLYRANLTGAQFELEIVGCYSFFGAQVSEGQLAWLSLHPKFGEWRDSLKIVGSPK